MDTSSYMIIVICSVTIPVIVVLVSKNKKK